MVESTVESVFKAVVDLTEKELIHVLHVDDELGFLKGAKQILEMQGNLKVETALSAEEALKKMEKKTFDVVVSDYQMPEKDGLEFLRELREKGDNIPFIMFTGKGREEVATQALNFGAQRYFNKIGAPETVYTELSHGIHQVVSSSRAEKALRKSEEKYRSIVELAPDSIMTFDLKGVITSCNTASTRLSGYSKDELVGKHFSRIAPIRATDIPKFLRMLPLTISGKVPKPFEVTFKHKDGTTRQGEVRMSLMKDEGRTIGFQAIMRDITERKKADVRLRESEKKFRDIFENANDVIVYGDLKGTILDLNQKGAELAGIEKEKILGKNFRKLGLISFRDVPKLLGRLARKALGKANTENFQLTITKKDGEKRFLEVNSTLIRRGKMPAGFLAIARDITERRKIQERVEKMNEKLEVVGKLARHDARNKLSAVAMNVFLAKQKLVDDNEALEHLSQIESAVADVERIFDFARIYEKIGMEELVYADVEKSFEEVVMLFSDLHGANIVNDCHGLTVLADSLLRQLFYNLIDNSLKHGEKVSRIRVYHEEVGKNQLKLVYEDDGVGIPKAEKKKIFIEGYGKGTGYGLFLIRKMCEVYGWTIRETGKQGKGAQFTITIPKMSESGKIAFQLH